MVFILYELENLGRHLVDVHWHNGLRLNVFPNEIEIIDGDPLWQSDVIKHRINWSFNANNQWLA